MTSVSEILSSDWVHRLGWVLLHSLWEIGVLAPVLGLTLAVLRRRSANLRYATACAGLAAMSVLPMVTYCIVPGRPSPEPVAVSTSFGNTTEMSADTVLPTAVSPSAALPNAEPPAIAPSVPSTQEAQAPAPPESQSDANPTSLLEQASCALSPCIPWLVIGWLVGVLVLSVWHLGGCIAMQRLKHLGTRPGAEQWMRQLADLLKQMKVSRPVRMLESAMVDVPMVVGWLRPVVLVPAAMLAEMSPQQIEAILAHELAHIRRYDYLVNLLQTVVETLLFYHPAVWWVSRRIRIEREHCCDDAAVAVCGSNLDYATALMAMEQSRVTSRLAVAATGAGRGGTALSRVRRVLGISENDSLRWRTSLGGSIAVLLLIGALAGYLAVANEPERNPEPSPADESAVRSGTDPEEPAGDSDRIAQLIEQLGHDTYDRREVAQRELIRIGAPAWAALKIARGHQDPEIAARAKRALAEISRQIEIRREKLREAASAASKRSDRLAAARHYKALLALPDPPLRDGREASRFFRAAEDWDCFALAQEVTAEAMERVIQTPAREFIRPAPQSRLPAEVEGPIVGGTPTIQVQLDLDGIWHNFGGGGTSPVAHAGDGTDPIAPWVHIIEEKQKRMIRERHALLLRLGRLSRDRLQRPDKAGRAFAEALADFDFYTEPIEKLIAQTWPVRSGQQAESIRWLLDGGFVTALHELSEMQQAMGDIDDAIETKTRELLARFVLAWNHPDGLVSRNAKELWSLVQQRPADAPLPPLFWFNVLSPQGDTITFDLPKPASQRHAGDLYDPNIVARPGYVFDTLEVTAEMEGPGARVYCTTLYEKYTMLGHIAWPGGKPAARERITKTLKIPEDAGVLYFLVSPKDMEKPRVHQLTVKASFRRKTAKAPAKPAAQAEARARQLKSKKNAFELRLAYHGPKDNPYQSGVGNPFRSLTIHTTRTDYRPAYGWSAVSISQEQAARIIDHLEEKGFLANARPLTGNTWPQVEGPAYSLRVEGPNKLILHEVLGWDLKMLRRLGGLRKALDGNAAKAMDKLLAALEPNRKLWEATAAETEAGDAKANGQIGAQITSKLHGVDFGPVWDNEVLDVRSAGSHGKCLIDFDTGRVIAWPSDGLALFDRKVGFTEDLKRFMKANGFDAVGYTQRMPDDPDGLVGFDMKLVPAGEQLSEISPGALRGALSRGRAPRAEVDISQSASKTWLFQTREGAQGVLKLGLVSVSNVRLSHKRLMSAEELAPWSGPVEGGLRLRLRPIASRWTLGEIPELMLDLWNDSRPQRPFPYLYVGLQEAECQIQYDGQWYRWADPVAIHARVRSLEAHRAHYGAVRITLDRSWARTDRPWTGEAEKKDRLKSMPGKHAVRIALTADLRSDGAEKRVRALSKPAQIEIVRDKPEPETASVRSDDENAVAALRKLGPDGAHLTLDDQGQVKEVWLCPTWATNAEMAHLEGLPKLDSLTIALIAKVDPPREIKMTEAALVHLRWLKNLKKLLLRIKVTDAGMAHLKALTKLEHLDLRHTLVTDAGLAHLNGMTNLQRLDLRDTQVTEAGLKKLKHASPNTSFHY